MRRAGWVVWCAALAGCATPSFQPLFKAPEAPKQTVVVGDLAKPQPRSERAVVVGLTTDPMKLFAWDLASGTLVWETPVEAKSAPLVAADAVVMQEEDGVVVRDLATGKIRKTVDDRAALVGADGQGSDVVIALAFPEKSAPGALVWLEHDRVRWRQTLNLPIGVPAISGEYVMVPWATQRLSVLTARDGLELARFHYKSSVMGQAVVDAGQLYVGQLGLLPVTAELLEQPNLKHVPYTPLKRTLPGQPPLLRDGYAPVADPDNAWHRLQVNWRIARGADGSLATLNDQFLLRFYRLLFALDAKADEIRWVRSFDHDLVGAAILPGGALIADSAGMLRYVDNAGATQYSAALGRELRVVSLRPAGWTPPPQAAAPAGSTDPAALAERPQGTLREQLYAAAALEDDRLGAGRAYAASYLGHFPEAEATGQLIALCSQRKSPEPVRAAACAQLRDRTTGEAAVLAALRARASFLDGADAPPVGPLAQAAAKLQLKAAGPLLVSHVEDPNTPARDLPAVFEALETLNERSAAISVERFVRLHHAEPEGSELGPALGSALHALAALHAKAQRPTLADVASDQLTPKPTREQAQAALALLDAPPPKAAAAVEPPAPPPQDEVQTDPRPYALTAEVVQKTLGPMRERLKHCLKSDASGPHVGRSSMVVDASGKVEGVFVAPATLQPCVEPILRGAQFPSTRLGRQRVTHVFSDGQK